MVSAAEREFTLFISHSDLNCEFIGASADIMAMPACAILMAVVAPLSTPGPILCDPDWADQEGFDCQLYEGADWCKPNGSEGSGWCQANEFQPTFPGNSCLTHVSYNYGWGVITTWRGGEGHHGNAHHQCASCGSASCPYVPGKRKPNSIPAGCKDHVAPDGTPWRDSNGYTCKAYQYGNFCVRGPDGKFTEGGLWKKNKDFGLINEYGWCAKKLSHGRQMPTTYTYDTSTTYSYGGGSHSYDQQNASCTRKGDDCGDDACINAFMACCACGGGAFM